MSTPLIADISRIKKIAPDFFIHSYLLINKKGIKLANLTKNLKKYLDPVQIEQALRQLQKKNIIRIENDKIEVLSSDKSTVKEILGLDTGKAWEPLQKRFELMALGFDPDAADIRKKKADWVYAAIAGVCYGLDKSRFSRTVDIRSELIWRTLSAVAERIIGKGPFPTIDKANAIDRTIINGLAESNAKTINSAMSALAAKILDADKATAKEIRLRLVRIALRTETQAGKTVEILTPQPGVNDFAGRVISIAKKLNTPPFSGKVAIAQVYDAYGRDYPDAGSLDSFKQRLVDAAKNQIIKLSTLDIPHYMEEDLRNRSQTPLGAQLVYLIVTDWI